MAKLEHIKELLKDINAAEGDGFVLNQSKIAEELAKYEKENASLIIKVVTILGALLGSSFLVSFFGMTGLFSKPFTLTIFAIILIASSVFLSEVSKSLLFETSFVAILLWGLFLLAISLSQLKINDNLVCLYFLLCGIVTLGLSKNTYQLLIAILVINGSILCLILLQKSFWLLHVYNSVAVLVLVQILFNEAKLITFNLYFSRLYESLKTGFVITIFASFFLTSVKNAIPFEIKYTWVSSLAPILAILFLVRQVLNKIDIAVKTTRMLVMFISLVLLVLTAIGPAISVSIFILLFCFFVNYKIGTVLGFVGLIYFIFQFYYDLNTSLLIKSEILFVSGLLFGLLYFFAAKKLLGDEKN